MKYIGLILAAALLAASPALRAAAAPEGDGMAAVMRGMFLAQSGAHARAARLFAQLGEQSRRASLLREAFREAVSAKAPGEALNYAVRWRALGGGAEAAAAEAQALLALNHPEDALEILAELKRTGEQTDEELLKFLRFAPRNQIAKLGRALFDDDAAGNLLLAKLATAVGDYAAAGDAIRRGLARTGAETELYLLQARIAARENPAAPPKILADYRARGCPEINSGCGERELLYAYHLYAENDENWRRALDNPEAEADEAALAAGRLLERAGLPERARPYYEKTRGRFFRANLGLARIARDAGRLSVALEILDAAAADDDSEFVLREVTASDVVEKLHGAGAALLRIRRALLTSPDSFDLLYRHSLLAEQTGDVAGAVAILEQTTELFPYAAEGWNALGYVLANNNLRLGEAETYIKKALKINPNSANILDSLGWVYYRQGKLRAALPLLLQAAAKSDSAEIAAHLGEVHWFLDEREKARAVFRDARAHDPGNEVLNETLRRLQIGN